MYFEQSRKHNYIVRQKHLNAVVKHTDNFFTTNPIDLKHVTGANRFVNVANEFLSVTLMEIHDQVFANHVESESECSLFQIKAYVQIVSVNNTDLLITSNKKTHPYTIEF